MPKGQREGKADDAALATGRCQENEQKKKECSLLLEGQWQWKERAEDAILATGRCQEYEQKEKRKERALTAAKRPKERKGK